MLVVRSLPGNYYRFQHMIDRASDAWGPLRLLVGRQAQVIISIVTAFAYVGAYLALREASNDQWYLPAGLRFAAVLLAPYRLWPALFVGEVAAILSLGVNKVPQYGWAYYIGSAIAPWPVVASIVREVRKRTALPKIEKATDAVALVVAALLSAELVSLVNKASSAYLKTTGGRMVYSDLIVYSLGHVQGILLVTFGSLLVASWRTDGPFARGFIVESACAVTLSALCALAVGIASPTDEGALIAMRLCLLLPAVALSVRHGWRGAALGGVVANVALFSTIAHQESGHVDGAALLMQEAFSFVAAALLVLGGREHMQAKSGGVAASAESDPRQLARAQIESHERRQRDTALRAEAMQRNSRGSIEPLVTLLRKNGQPEAAMSLRGLAHTHSVQFGLTVIESIYPLTLERRGLYLAVESGAFARHFGDAEPDFELTGSPHGLALETKLAAYRVLGEAIEHLALSLPMGISVRIHCSTKPDGRGMVSMALRAIGPSVTSRSAFHTARLAQLRSHVAAYGGSLHNRVSRMRLIVLDETPLAPPSSARAGRQRAVCHTSP